MHWNELTYQRSFMNDLGKKFNISTIDDWFSITNISIQQHGGSAVLQKYNGSLCKLLATVFPEYKQACVNFVTNVMKEKKLTKIEDVIHVPLEYQKLFVG